MSKPNKNILALFHDGYYLAQIDGGIRAAHQDGRKVDFKAGSVKAVMLETSYLHDTMEDMRKKAIGALEGVL